MSRRGANLRSSERFAFTEVGALGRPIVKVARELLAEGLSSAELCSLLTQTAALLAQQRDGLGSREEWLALAGELFDAQNDAEEQLISAPGGSA